MENNKESKEVTVEQIMTDMVSYYDDAFFVDLVTAKPAKAS